LVLKLNKIRIKIAGPGRQPGGFLCRPKESHIKKGPEKRLSPDEDTRLTGVGLTVADKRERLALRLRTSGMG